MEAETRVDIFKARQELHQAEDQYATQLKEFAGYLDELKDAESQVRIKGFPGTAAVRIDHEDGSHHFVHVPVAKYVPIEGQPAQPIEKVGMILDYGVNYDDLVIRLGGKVGGGYFTFSVSCMHELEVLEDD